MRWLVTERKLTIRLCVPILVDDDRVCSARRCESRICRLLTRETVSNIKESLLESWRRFDFDVYGAAFVLSPYMHARVNALNVPPPDTSET